MRRGLFVPLAATLVLVAACRAEDPPDPQFAPNAEDRAACLAEGGEYRRGGLLQAFICFKPTPDAGQACTTGADCTGLCLAETMTCSTITPLFGCHDIVAEDGARVGLCID